MALSNALHNALIMMVDDEPVMINLIQIYLEEAGYTQFYGLSDSTKAIEELEQKQPDLLLLDLVMPDVDGFEVLRAVRADPKTKHLPVVVLTSSSDTETKLKALELGATDFLAKPVDSSELILRLRNTLRSKFYQDQLAYYDPITGLPNRKLFVEQTEQMLQCDNQWQGGLSVLSIRLVQFGKLAETYGAHVRDLLLKVAAQRLLSNVRTSRERSDGQAYGLSSVVAYLGGDEFAITLAGIPSDRETSLVAERLLQVFQQSIVSQQQEIFLRLSVGIASSPNDGATAETLLSRASGAAELAVESVSSYRFFSETANRQLKHKLTLHQQLHKGIEQGQFYLVYQPQVDAQTHKVRGAEALLRWHHPEGKTVPPAEFVPIAEDTGLMVALGTFVLRQACSQAVAWRKQGIENCAISINVSGQQFKDENFVATVTAIMEETGATADDIIIEITESVSMSDQPGSRATIEGLRDMGIEIAVDDFGTGYCSLGYLKDLPVNELKIDKSFVDGLPSNKGDQAIASAIVAMSKKLNLRLVAEGVEHEAQLKYLTELGVDYIQGYYFARPMPADQFVRFCGSDLNLLPQQSCYGLI